MLVCNHCGHKTESLSSGRIYDDNLLGGYIDQADTTCPCCGNGEMIEATKCSVCGEWFDNSELHGVCEGCLEEHYTVGMALEIGDNNRELVDINSFIKSLLTDDEINKILEKYVEEHYTDGCREVRDYLDANKSCFSAWVEEKGAE